MKNASILTLSDIEAHFFGAMQNDRRFLLDSNRSCLLFGKSDITLRLASL